MWPCQGSDAASAAGAALACSSIKTGGERVSIAAGFLDAPQGLKISVQIFVTDAGDYYPIDAKAPVLQRGGHSAPLP